jgi:hypothetical protein
LLAPVAHAQVVRAWLDRDRIALDETATLNIEVTGVATGTPDYAPLLRDFRLSGHSSTRSYQQVNGRSQVRTLYGVALQPLREGTLEVPPLEVAGLRTPGLSRVVGAASVRPAHAGDVAFVDSEVDARAPYVQQAVGYVVRLYVGVPLVSGELEQPEPEGTTLQRVGDDVRYTRRIDGRDYTVIERRYLLVPERSGPLVVPGARFRGRGVGGFFDEFLGGGNDALQATGASKRLQVRPVPADAPQPWLPLQSLDLRWTATPRQARVGAAATVTLEARADGATAAQLPDLQLPPVPGAQVFADPVQVDERFVDGRPQATARRTFSIVPEHAGPLRIQGPSLAWWEVGAGRAREATVPPLELQVAAGSTPGSSVPPVDAAPARAADEARRVDPGVHVPGVQGRVRPWAVATVAFALAWLATLAWGLHRRPSAPAKREAHVAVPVADAGRGLRRALQSGDLAEIADALCAGAIPPAAGLDAVLERLADPAQHEAVAALQRARWGGGDPRAARDALRSAFRDGPRWRAGASAPREPLPPLYP